MSENLVKNNISYTIGTLIRDVRHHFDKQFKALNLTRYEWLILALLHQNQGTITQKLIQSYTGIENSYLTKILDKLEKKHFINKTICPDDKRNRIITVNSQSQKTINKVYKIIDETNSQLLSNLNEKEKKLLFSSLQKISQNI